MTKKQALMHEVRRAAIEQRSNPAAAIIQAITTHLRVTVDAEQFNTAVFELAAPKALLPNGMSVAANHAKIGARLVRNRDRLKRFLREFQAQAEAPPWASPLHGRDDDGNEAPPSPYAAPPRSPLTMVPQDGSLNRTGGHGPIPKRPKNVPSTVDDDLNW